MCSMTARIMNLYTRQIRISSIMRLKLKWANNYNYTCRRLFRRCLQAL